MSGRGSPIDQVHQQRILQTEDRNRLAAIMQTTLNTMGPLRDVRPNQDEDAAMFPTPGNSPPYTNDGGACYPAQTDMSCQYPPSLTQAGINGLNMPTVPVSSATQYCNIPAPGSPVDEAYYHGQTSPYSPPYDDTSSPHSMACSPHSNVSCSPIACTGANFDTYMPPPPVDSLASMASTGVSLPPITSIPLTTTTTLQFPTELDSHKSVYTTAPPPTCNFYPPISQTGAWPQQLTRFNEPGFVPPHSAAMICTSVADGGEVPINVIEQPGFPDTDSIAYYPLTPESPENRQAAYTCHDFAMQKPGLYLPHGAPIMCAPFSTHVKPTTSTKAPKRKRPQKPAVQVDDTEIKDIPTSAQLWEFTLRVLKKPKYHYMVNWENKKEGLFRFHDAQAFAALWGKHRNRPNMTYDKVARALRYYYKRDILNQVGGRLTYRFSKRLSKLYMTDE